jgi:hypothetical protein
VAKERGQEPNAVVHFTFLGQPRVLKDLDCELVIADLSFVIENSPARV